MPAVTAHTPLTALTPLDIDRLIRFKHAYALGYFGFSLTEGYRLHFLRWLVATGRVNEG